MGTTQSLWHVLSPFIAFGIVGVLMLVLRWAYGGRRQSLVERRPRTGRSNEYGLLVPVSSPASAIEAEIQRRRLEDSGIRATVVTTAEGARLMVFGDDAGVARAILGS